MIADFCRGSFVTLDRPTPAVSVLDGPPLLQPLADGGSTLELHLAVRFGPYDYAVRAGIFGRVEDLGPEPELKVEEIAGTWSNGLKADFSLDGGFLPALRDQCDQPRLALEVHQDGTVNSRRLNWSDGTGDVYASYSLRTAAGRLVIDGRRLIFAMSGETTERLDLLLDEGTQSGETTVGTSFEFKSVPGSSPANSSR